MNNQYDITRYVQSTERPMEPSFNMESIYFVMMVIGAIIIFFLIIKYMNGNKSSSMISTPSESYTEPVDPLTEKGWEVIVSDRCPYCIKQREILTAHFPTFKNIFNDKPANVVPTWRNTKTGQELPGMMTYEKLLDLIK